MCNLQTRINFAVVNESLYKLLSETVSYAETLKFTAQKMKFSIKDFFSKCGQIPSFLLADSF